MSDEATVLWEGDIASVNGNGPTRFRRTLDGWSWRTHVGRWAPFGGHPVGPGLIGELDALVDSLARRLAEVEQAARLCLRESEGQLRRPSAAHLRARARLAELVGVEG